ncbi:YMR1 Phosphoinositide 3-phosphatase [Candida maltosa Xu316]
MDNIFTVNDVILNRRGYHIPGTLYLSSFHLVFSFNPNPSANTKISKARGSSWISNYNNNGNTKLGAPGSTQEMAPPKIAMKDFDHYSASHIRLHCKDFTYYSFDFTNDLICTELFTKLSSLITISKTENDIKQLYAYEYRPNMIEQELEVKGWDIYDPIEEYTRLGLIRDDDLYWRITNLNNEYKFCSSYPKILVVPSTISDNVLKHASKFRSKQRIPAIVYKHKGNINGNVIARCSQPLVGLNIQNRSIQDEKLIGEIFACQERERKDTLKNSTDNDFQSQQLQKNLLVDLRPITNAIGQHALGAGTENVDNYRGKPNSTAKDSGASSTTTTTNNTNNNGDHQLQVVNVDKIFCNIDNIHVMRDTLNKLTAVLNDLDRYPTFYDKSPASSAMLQQTLAKTQWLTRLSIILQSVDRITKSIHLNNTNVIIHCSDGWDRTSQVSALAQLCLDPYYRTMKGFMVLVEKEWISFGFKFATRADHGGCIGAIVKKELKNPQSPDPDRKDNTNNNNNVSNGDDESSQVSLESSVYSESFTGAVSNAVEGVGLGSGAAASVTSFFQRAARAARDLKNTAQNGLSSSPGPEDGMENGKYVPTSSIYGGSNEKSPVFHQFLDCVYQIYRQNPTKFEFNSRFLKRLLYHYYSCQYGTFLGDSERQLYEMYKVHESTVSVWDYFNSRPSEFSNKEYEQNADDDDGVIFVNFADLKWWVELYGFVI